MFSQASSQAATPAAIAEELARFRVVEPEQLTSHLADFTGDRVDAFVAFLVSRKVLTPFQADRVLAGDAAILALGPYRLTAPATPGAIGSLFTATHRDRPGEAYRIRVLPLRNLWRAREAKRLLRSLGECSHPRVVPPTDADSANGYHYLVWPHPEGVTLADRVAASGPLPPDRGLELLAHLADALHACHARGVSHGALAPRSVLLDPDGLPRLLDLGAGSLLSTNVADNESLLDTMCAADAASAMLEYASPEFCAEPTPTPAADQYSLAAVGYLALAGHSPFPGLSIAAQFAAKQAGYPPLLHRLNPAVPEDLAKLIDRMLRPTPAERYSGIDEVHERLLSVMGPGASRSGPYVLLTARAEGPAPPAHRPRDRTPEGGLVRAFGVRPSPARDGSDDSIDFELPPPDTTQLPPPHTAPLAPRLARVIDTPKGLPKLDAASQPQAQCPRPPVNSPPPAPCSPQTSPIQRSPLSDGSAMTPPLPSTAKNPQQAPERPTPIPTLNTGAKPPTPRGGLRACAVPAPGLEPADEIAVPRQSFWRRLARSLMVWKAPRDVVQLSVFGPLEASPGQTVKVTVSVHTPDAAASSRTLARAFQHDAELIGTAFLDAEVARGADLDVRLSMPHAGVSKPVLRLVWRGQPHRLTFDVNVLWEAGTGVTEGEVSVSRKGAGLGGSPFRLRVLPRRG